MTLVFRSHVATAALLATAVPTTAQQLLASIEGLAANDRIGYSVVGFRDPSGNATIVTAGHTSTTFGVQGGRARAFHATTNGVSEILSWWLVGTQTNDYYGYALAEGEPGTFLVTRPGFDNGVGSDAGAMELLDATTSARVALFEGTIANARFGRSALFIGDMNGDALPDYAFGSIELPRRSCPPSSREYGSVLVGSHAAGTVSVLGRIDGQNGCNGYSTWSYIIGDVLAAPGDLTGDGLDDLLIGSWDSDRVYI
ncbi:MAG: hypothetical protein KDC98_23015, partial [Planctomycetes bacterium]|nr:hypothetical protein [Planctomycetota bacterium]